MPAAFTARLDPAHAAAQARQRRCTATAFTIFAPSCLAMPQLAAVPAPAIHKAIDSILVDFVSSEIRIRPAL